FPWHVHAEGLTVRGADSNIQWLLHLDRVQFDFTVWRLLRRQLYFSHVRGSGITYRLRTRQPSPELTEERLAHLPPIPGFGTLPIRSHEGPGADVWSDAAYHLYTVNFEDTVAEDVREVWVNGARIVGNLRVAGGFHLKPNRNVWVGPLDIDVRKGDLSL